MVLGQVQIGVEDKDPPLAEEKVVSLVSEKLGDIGLAFKEKRK